MAHSLDWKTCPSSSSSSVCSSLTSRDTTPPPATSPLSPPVHPPASKKCTFDAAFPSPPPCYPSSPLDDEVPDWIEVRHRVLLFKEWREKRRRGDKEEGCSLMRGAGNPRLTLALCTAEITIRLHFNNFPKHFSTQAFK